jgi:transcriptional regulator with XRE-family HTH domain
MTRYVGSTLSGNPGHAAPSQVFARQLRAIRKRRGLSLRALEASLRDAGYPLGRSALSEIERGERAVSLNDSLAIAAVLNLSWAYLLTTDTEPVALAPGVIRSGRWVRAWLRGQTRYDYDELPLDEKLSWDGTTIDVAIAAHRKTIEAIRNADRKAQIEAAVELDRESGRLEEARDRFQRRRRRASKWSRS